MTWRNVDQGFPVQPTWSISGTIVYGALDPFTLQRPLNAIQQFYPITGTSVALYQRPPESIDEQILGMVHSSEEGDRLLVDSQHPGCGLYNLRLVTLANGEAVTVWPAGLRQSTLVGTQLLLLPATPTPGCEFGLPLEGNPTLNLYSLDTLSPTLEASITDPVPGILAQNDRSLWVSALDPNQLTRIEWGEGTIVTRTVQFPVAINTFQQVLPADQQWVGWNPGRSVLWVGDFAGDLQSTQRGTVRQLWQIPTGFLVSFEAMPPQQGGIATVEAGSQQLHWVDLALFPNVRIEISQK